MYNSGKPGLSGSLILVGVPEKAKHTSMWFKRYTSAFRLAAQEGNEDMMRETFTAKSIEEAKQAAISKIGLPEEKIVFRILEAPKKSLFGKIKREAVVEAVYEMEETPSPAAESLTLEESTVPENPAVSEAATATVSEETAVLEETAAPEETVDDLPESVPTQPSATVLDENDLSASLLAAKQYIIDIYHAMGIEVTVTVKQLESSICMEVDSTHKSGTIIGRRGETLDSIQYLASIIANRGEEEYCRLLLDSNGYREKRRKTLEQLADKIARSVLRTGRPTTLEPMNPYERRIIHSRISEIEGVTSRSVGEDPYRKVVISSATGRHSGGRNGGKNNARGNRRPPHRERKPEEFQRSDLDSMKTSFERDYKKPKPEDDLYTGLYGKIEL